MMAMGISQIRGYQPGRRGVGRQARARARPGRGEGGDPPDRLPLAVGRALRACRRQARARPALPRRPGHGQDDARQGDRDRLQLALRDDSRLGVRADVRRARLDPRALPRAQGQAARPQVGRPVHRLHRRDRRRRDAAKRARRAPRRAFEEPTFEQSGDLVLETRAWREKQFALRAPERRPPSRLLPAGQPGVPGRGRRHVRGPGKHGPEPAARRDGRARQPAARPPHPHQHDEHPARRALRRPAEVARQVATPAAAAPAPGADLLHRRDERPDRRSSTRR